MIIVTIILTIAAMLGIQRGLAYLAARPSFDRDWQEIMSDNAYGICDMMGWRVVEPEPEDRATVTLSSAMDAKAWREKMNERLRIATQGWTNVPGLDRYPEDGSNPFIPFITRIVVPDEYCRVQVMLALRYLHDQMTTDTDYMAVNALVHLYADETGEPTGATPWIVVE